MELEPTTPFRESYHSILGQIVVAMGQIELQISLLLIHMLGQNQGLAVNLTFGAHLDRIIDIMKAVFYSKHQDDETAPLFEYLVGEINRLNHERNKNFHCAWTFDSARERANRFRISKHTKGVHHANDWKEVPFHELQNLNGELNVLNDEIRAFNTKYYSNPKAKITPDQRRATDDLISEMQRKAKSRAKPGKK